MKLARLAATTAAAAAVVAGALAWAGPAHAAPAGQGATSTAAAVTVSKQTLHFAVTHVGPSRDQSCDVVGDLYTPSTATPTSPVPAILTTNGFGGSKDDQADIAEAEAQRGYVVLSYSGLGFGANPQTGEPGSTCQIEINDPDWDGLAGSQLISFLGGAPGIGYTTFDETTGTYSGEVDEKSVVHDAVDHDGTAQQYDPRVGMIGGSEGGEIQFSIAGVDHRLDMIIPQITWNDLAYSLGPNNATLPPNSVSYGTPGVLKLDWPVLFSGVGVADGVEKGLTQPVTLANANTVCPNFDRDVCRALVESAALGYPPAAGDQTDPLGLLSAATGGAVPTDVVDFLRHRSVTSYLTKIEIPVLLSQGQADTLFELSESAATFEQLKARGVPVHMIWQEWGHSGSAVEGEDIAGDTGSPDWAIYQAWFDHYLKDEPVDLGPTFTYFRDWAYHPGTATGSAADAAARAAYASSPTYPVASGVTYALSGADGLTSGTPAAGTASFVAPAVVGASYTETSAVDQTAPITDAPGTTASFDGPAYAQPVDLVGFPTATLHLSAPTATAAAGPVDELALFLRLEDVGPDGTAVLPHRLVAAFRSPDLSQPVTVQLPGIVHELPAGHHLRLVVAGSDLAFHGNEVAQAVTVSTGPGAAASTLTVPALGATTATPPATVPGGPTAPAAPAVPARTTAGGLAVTGPSALLPVLALALLALAAGTRRLARRRG